MPSGFVGNLLKASIPIRGPAVNLFVVSCGVEPGQLPLASTGVTPSGQRVWAGAESDAEGQLPLASTGVTPSGQRVWAGTEFESDVVGGWLLSDCEGVSLLP